MSLLGTTKKWNINLKRRIFSIIIIIIIIIIVVVGALGSVSKKLAGHLEQLGIKNRTRTMQKSALLGSAHILRKVLEV